MSRSYRMFLAALLIFLGILLGLVGTFVPMLILSFKLDRNQPAGPGSGAMVFYLSLILCPLAGGVGGLLGGLLGRWVGLWAPD
jgi:hypothetical protein